MRMVLADFSSMATLGPTSGPKRAPGRIMLDCPLVSRRILVITNRRKARHLANLGMLGMDHEQKENVSNRP